METRMLRTFNDEQQQAIDHRGTPLRIIAGAGTGKTATLTARFVSLVERNEADIGQILALTFTRKAAAEMRERIIAQLDRSYTEFWVETFHAFCLKVLRIERAARGLPAPALIDGHARLLLLQAALEGETFPAYGRRQNELLRQALVFIDRAKDENLSPAETLEIAHARDNPQWHDLARAYALYQKRLTFGDRDFDWGELQTRLINLFEQNEGTLERWRNRFRHILVDEYQDINHAQYKLIRLLAGDGANLTVVGDVDQSIYAFRGASHRLLAGMEEDYPDIRTIHLSSNFRSHQQILDVGNALIRLNPDTHERQELKAFDGRRGAVPVVIQARDEDEEADSIARQIARLYWLDGVPLEEIAVLLRSVQMSAEPIERALASYGLRSTLSGDATVEGDVAADVLAVLKLIDGTSSAHLIRVLTRQDVDAVQILSAQVEADANGVDLIEILTKTNPVIAPIARCTLAQSAALAERPLPEQVYEAGIICRRLPLGTSISRDDYRCTRSLSRLIDRAMHLAEAGGTRDHFIAELSGGIPNTSDKETPDDSAVQIMTVHAAKGLEFQHVFVANLATGRFPLKRRLDRGLDLSQPESLRLTGDGSLPGDAERKRNFLEEERRLGYVALTRASEQLYLSHAEAYDRATGSHSVFLNDIRAAGDDLVTTQKPTQVEENTWNATELARLQQAVINRALDSPTLDAAAIADMLLAQWTLGQLPGANLWRATSPPVPYQGDESLRLSYSALSTYDTCPRRYYYANVLGLPDNRSSAYMLRGTAIHNALQWMNEQRRDGAFPDEHALIEHFRTTWNRAGFDAPAQERQIRERSEQLLRRFHRYEREQEREILDVEVRFDTPLDGNILTGRIDCVARRSDGTIEIIDYKSSKSAPKKEQLQLQLGMYQMAYRHLYPDSNPTAMLYILGHDDDKNGIFAPEFDAKKQSKPQEYDPEVLDNVTGTIHDIASSILRNEFPTTTNAYTCNGCAYRHVCEGANEDG